MDLLEQLQQHKKEYCQGKKGAYQKMRSTCKTYVDAARNNAPYGQKGKTEEKARNRANAIINENCQF